MLVSAPPQEVERRLLHTYHYACKKNGDILVNTCVVRRWDGIFNDIIISVQLTEVAGHTEIAYRARLPYYTLAIALSMLGAVAVVGYRCIVNATNIMPYLAFVLLVLLFVLHLIWQLQVCAEQFEKKIQKFFNVI